MEFWGVEVKAGEKLKVQPEFGQLIHISQAALGELKDVKDVKGSKNIPLRMKIDDKNFIIGNLSAEDRTQVMFDLVFEREFELSHDWKHGSIFFIGYVADDPVSEGEDFSDSDESADEDELVAAQDNGTAKAKAGVVKPAERAAAVAKKGAEDKGKKVEEPESDDDDSEFDSDDEMDGLPEADSSDASGDDSDEEDESEEEELPKAKELPKAQQSKKRLAESAEKTPLAKKAKAATPDKSGKKGQNATPATGKSAGKTPNKSKNQSPKSGGQHSCKSCTKTFPSEFAMQSHAKAKHGGK
ncbi:hypothetical protein C2S51_004808 [Perilla frutescens var. frutescens]|nr:hypothetical protein C2S51_004808 [Perilla frutescens var. frutescens]